MKGEYALFQSLPLDDFVVLCPLISSQTLIVDLKPFILRSSAPFKFWIDADLTSRISQDVPASLLIKFHQPFLAHIQWVSSAYIQWLAISVVDWVSFKL